MRQEHRNRRVSRWTGVRGSPGLPAGVWWPVAAALACAGCAPSQVRLFVPQAAPTTVPASYDTRDWATVLRENVKDGLVDYDHLVAHREPLDRCLALLAVVGPRGAEDQFPSPADRLAYYLNAYNAGVLAAVLHEEIPPTMHDVHRRPLEQGYLLRVDGQVWRLADLREAVRVESLGDARVEFCLCDGARGSPGLRPEPYRADTLDETLRAVAREAMDSARMVSIDHEEQSLRVGLTIWRRRQALLDYYRRETGSASATLLNVLLHVAGGERRQWLNTAVGYRVGVIPFDRALNRWTRSPAGQGGGR